MVVLRGGGVSCERGATVSTKGPMWGYPVFVLGAISSFLELFRGHLSPKIDKVSEELTLRYHHEEPWVGTPVCALQVSVVGKWVPTTLQKRAAVPRRARI